MPQHLVEEYVQYRLLGFHQCELSLEPGDPKELTAQLASQSDSHGPTALLPQSLSEELLERLIGHWRALLCEDEEHSGGSLLPFIFCVICITHALLLKGDPRIAEFTMTLEEMKSATDNYSFWLELELITRRTRVRFTRPTLETIFQGSAQVSVHLADSGQDSTGPDAQRP